MHSSGRGGVGVKVRLTFGLTKLGLKFGSALKAMLLWDGG